MTRYFFDVLGKLETIDACGLELPSTENAWIEAARSAAEMARDKTFSPGRFDHVTTIKVRDKSGPVWSVTMTLHTVVGSHETAGSG